jgi:uncharacterized protein (TIGR02452 family)
MIIDFVFISFSFGPSVTHFSIPLCSMRVSSRRGFREGDKGKGKGSSSHRHNSRRRVDPRRAAAIAISAQTRVIAQRLKETYKVEIENSLQNTFYLSGLNDELLAAAKKDKTVSVQKEASSKEAASVGKEASKEAVSVGKETPKEAASNSKDSKNIDTKGAVTTDVKAVPAAAGSGAAPSPTIRETITIEVVNQDTIDCGKRLQDQGLFPLVLNMASARAPGGGWETGAEAQEESLFRKTTMHLNMEQPHIYKKYPLSGTAGIYARNVIVFRNNQYEVLKSKDQFCMSFIAMPFLRNPNLVKGEFHPDDKLATLNKIRLIFKTALRFGHDSLVLGAGGCGAFHNPPHSVAECFQQVIGEYSNVFKMISFAIITDKNDTHGNFAAFENVILAEPMKPVTSTISVLGPSDPSDEIPDL